MTIEKDKAAAVSKVVAAVSKVVVNKVAVANRGVVNKVAEVARAAEIAGAAAEIAASSKDRPTKSPVNVEILKVSCHNSPSSLQTIMIN